MSNTNQQLFEAVINGDLGALEAALNAGASVNAIFSTNGWTALHTAALNGHTDCQVTLLRYKADEGDGDKEGLASALAKMRSNVIANFKSGTISRSQCFTDENPSRVTGAVLDALALKLFEEKVAARLSWSEEGKNLLNEVIQSLPKRIKSIYAATLESCTQKLQPHRSFAERIADNPSQERSR